MARPAFTLLALLLALAGLAACGRPGKATKPVGTPAARPLVYVAIGASDAVGVGAGGPDQSWVADLYRTLPPGSRLINLGISGATMQQALTDELPVAVDANPDLVTIWLAVNDLNARVTPERYEQDLDSMLKTLRDRTHARIVIGNVPDLSLVPAYAGIDRTALQQEVLRWNAIIARQSASHGAILVDLHASWQDLADHPEYVGIDGFHPSADGYQQLASLFAAAIQAHGGDGRS